MKRNASDFAYQMIKAKILSQEYPPGSQLKEMNISKELGVTRTPVREAIIKLEREGIAKLFHNRGAFVASLSEKEIEDLFEIREALETKAMYLAYRKASRNEIAEIRNGLAKRENFFRQGIPPNHSEEVLDFHFEIIKLAKNEKMLSIWKTLGSQLCLARITSTMFGKRYLEALKEHKQILSSLAEGNFGKTERLLKVHISKAKDNLLAYCRHVKGNKKLSNNV